MSRMWDKPNVPHKGWTLENVIDVRGKGQTVDEADYETCMMCNHERIRYIHIVSHAAVNSEFRVGCVCAEKMTGDYVNPKRLENRLKSKASRLSTWMRKRWAVNANGTHVLKYEGHQLLIFVDQRTGKYKCKVGSTWGKRRFDSIEDAKKAIFGGIEIYKNKGTW